MEKSISTSFSLGQDAMTPQLLTRLSKQSNPSLDISDQAINRTNELRSVVDGIVKSGAVVYGINTGFGFLSDVAIDADRLEELQLNLIRSHACGVGALADQELVRAVIILKLHNFLLGGSGVSLECINFLKNLVDLNIMPEVPEQGSVGACGDLAPLSHIALTMIGEGRAWYKGELSSVDSIFQRLGIKRYRPLPKEGLSLINGTQFMTAIAARVVSLSKVLMQSADVISALSLGAFRGTAAAFDSRIHSIRPHMGQGLVAANLRTLLEDDQILASHKDCGKVQDPYSFRCIPQVHGSCRDTLGYTELIIQRELNSVTDNPLIFSDGTALSGGNFHGQPVAMATDYLAVALAEIGSISERRIEKLTNPNLSGLPPFIIKDSGLNSGFMIPHVVAASLVSENKVLCHPASIDSIPTSADKEDHVSMGPISSRKCGKVLENISNILAIELLSACQGIDLISPLQPSRVLSAVKKAVREISPQLNKDRSIYRDIKEVSQWILDGGICQILLEEGIQIN